MNSHSGKVTTCTSQLTALFLATGKSGATWFPPLKTLRWGVA